MTFLLTYTLGYFLLILVLFLLGRRIVLWYMKIDESILLQKETNRLLRKIAGEKEIEEPLANEGNEPKNISKDESNKMTGKELEDYNKRLYG
jgi:hypothetical protein